MAEVELEAPGGGQGPLVTLESIEGDVVPRTKVSLNDKFFLAVDADVKWGFVSGVDPQTLVIPMIRAQAERVVDEIEGDVTLKTSGPTGRLEELEREFKKLWLNIRSPYGYRKDALLLQDRRWTWGKPKVTKAFNLTRRSNDFLTFDGIVPEFLENVLVEAVPYYVETTILLDDNGEPLRPYTALDIVYEILRDVLGYADTEIDITQAATTNYVPSNQYIEGQSAKDVVQRYLALGGNDLYIEDDGSVVIYDRTKPFDETDFFALFGNGIPEKVAGSDLYVVDYKAVRPHEIEVQNPVEAELLITFQDSDGTETTTGEDSPADNFEDGLQQIRNGQVYARNVTRTIVPNQVEDYPAGTVVDFEEAVEAYGDTLGTPTALTLDDWRETYGDDNPDMLNAYDLAATGGALPAEATINAIRVFGQLNQDFRSLFQVPDYVMKQLLGMKAVLADIQNPESQTRVPSPVFSTVSWFINEAFLLSLQENPHGAKLDSFASTPYTPIPAKVSIEDEDLGLVRIQWLGDLEAQGVVSRIMPGVAVKDIYDDSLGDGTVALQGGDGYHAGVEADWECSMIVSVVPFPNNDATGKRHFRQVFQATDFGEDGDGPRIVHFSNLDTARFRLPDTLDEYVGDRAKSTDKTLEDLATALDILEGQFGETLSEKMGVSGPMRNFEIISAINRAEAQRIYRTFNNQLEGEAVFAWDEFWTNVRPRASMRNIVYSVSNNGQPTVSIKAERLRTPRSILNSLPRSILELTGRVLQFENLKGG